MPIPYFFFLLFFLFFFHCSKEVDEMFNKKPQKRTSNIKDYTSIDDYQMSQFNIHGKKYDTFADNVVILNSGNQEFIFSNINVLFYQKKKTNTISSQNGKMDEYENLFFYKLVRGNFKTEKKSFNCEYLRYARNSNQFFFKTNVTFFQNRDTIYGENFVWDRDRKNFSSISKIKIVTANGDRIEGKSFYSDDEFKSIEIFNGNGTTEIDDFDD